MNDFSSCVCPDCSIHLKIGRMRIHLAPPTVDVSQHYRLSHAAWLEATLLAYPMSLQSYLSPSPPGFFQNLVIPGQYNPVSIVFFHTILDVLYESQLTYTCLQMLVKWYSMQCMCAKKIRHTAIEHLWLENMVREGRVDLSEDITMLKTVDLALAHMESPLEGVAACACDLLGCVVRMASSIFTYCRLDYSFYSQITDRKGSMEHYMWTLWDQVKDRSALSRVKYLVAEKVMPFLGATEVRR